ncbi:Calcium-activated potassium channel slo-1 [Lamellibrachia satsuma]|nr:Calcium-activated potassium channel slo-1 [Lamellibrachia satsuma]
MLEGSGQFHWCPSRKLDDCLLDDISVREHNFSNHVIVIFPAREVAHPLELGNFVLPLRASSFRYKELKDIVILVRDVEFLRKTWGRHFKLPPTSTCTRATLRDVEICGP